MEKKEIKVTITKEEVTVTINDKDWSEATLQENILINSVGQLLVRFTTFSSEYAKVLREVFEGRRYKFDKLLVQLARALRGLAFQNEKTMLSKDEFPVSWDFCKRLMDMLRTKQISTADTDAYIFNKVMYDLKKKKSAK